MLTDSSLAMRVMPFTNIGAIEIPQIFDDAMTASVAQFCSGDHQRRQIRCVDFVDRLAEQDTRRDAGRDAGGTILQKSRCGVAECSARVDGVIEQHAGLARHIANDVHHLGGTRFFAALVSDRQAE